jgi:hypothetical protein
VDRTEVLRGWIRDGLPGEHVRCKRVHTDASERHDWVYPKERRREAKGQLAEIMSGKTHPVHTVKHTAIHAAAGAGLLDVLSSVPFHRLTEAQCDAAANAARVLELIPRHRR